MKQIKAEILIIEYFLGFLITFSVLQDLFWWIKMFVSLREYKGQKKNFITSILRFKKGEENLLLTPPPPPSTWWDDIGPNQIFKIFII